MTARQGLRSVTMPALFVVATLFFWRGLERATATGDQRSGGAVLSFASRHLSFSIPQSPGSDFLLAGLFLGLTFYTYIPSRFMWLVFPALLLYLSILKQPAPWRQAVVMLLVGGLVALPLFLFLVTHPGLEIRISQLAGPLRTAAGGDFGPLLENARGALGLFTVTGDEQWRYNITGRPWLPLPMGILFYVGLGLAMVRVARCALFRSPNGRRPCPGLFLALVWLFLGLSPALVTGPDLSTTQAIALQPVLFLFPALPLIAAADWLGPRLPRGRRRLLPLLAVLLFAGIGFNTWRDYFAVWAKAPEVAVQYESNLVEVIRYLNAQGEGAVSISTDAPSRFHDPAAARLYLDNDDLRILWYDGRHALLLPQDGGTALLFMSSAPLHPALAPYLESLPISQERPEPGFRHYEVSHSQSPFEALYPQFNPKINNLSTELSTDIRFGASLRFLGNDLQRSSLQAGDTLRMATLWEVQSPPEAQEELVLFTHVLDERGRLVAQADRLDAPVHSWEQGDLLIQLHEIRLPDGLAEGRYSLSVGAYEAADWRLRLPVTVDGSPSGDSLLLPSSVEVTP
jgi:hypothetical protein